MRPLSVERARAVAGSMAAYVPVAISKCRARKARLFPWAVRALEAIERGDLPFGKRKA
jgi:hypothetical protein